jgi:hypothetical protein
VDSDVARSMLDAKCTGVTATVATHHGQSKFTLQSHTGF